MIHTQLKKTPDWRKAETWELLGDQDRDWGILEKRYETEIERIKLEVLRRMPKIKANKRAQDVARRERERRRRKILVEQQQTQVLVDQRREQEDHLTHFRDEAALHRTEMQKRYEKRQHSAAVMADRARRSEEFSRKKKVETETDIARQKQEYRMAKKR